MDSSDRKSRHQTFKEEYTATYDFIKASRKGNSYAFCNVCGCDFSIAAGGLHDIKKHIKTSKHRSMIECKKTNRPITQFLSSTSSNFDVIRAETIWTLYVIENNMPFTSSDGFCDIVKIMFPDSKIAKDFSCRRTKTSSIARKLGQCTQDDIVQVLKETPFSLSTDGSSDRGAEEQMYPIVVRYFNETVNRVVGVLLEIAITEDRSTGINIFKLLDKALKEKKIPWKNCICFSADNAAVMMGIHAGVAAYVKKENPNVFVLGCPCHRLHLAAEKGASALPFSPADVLVSMYYYLEKSSKRHKELKSVQTMCGTANHKILKHVCTRWLSLEKGLNRLLEQWPALVEFFQREAGVAEKRKKEDVPVDSHAKKHKSSSDQSLKSSTRSPGAYVIPKKKPAINPAPKKTSASVHPTSKSTVPKKTTASVHLTSASTVPYKKTKAYVHPTSASTATKSTVSKETVQNKQKTVKSKASVTSSVKAAAKPTSTTKARSTKSTATTKAENIHASLSDYNKLYCLFLKQTIPLFTKTNLELQKDEPMIHLLDEKLTDCLKGILMRFVKPVVMKACTHLNECCYKDQSNQRTDTDLILGDEIRTFMNEHNFTTEQLSSFYTSVRKYFVTVCDYIIATFPLSDELLKHASVANIRKREEVSFSSLAYFVKRFHLMEDVLDTLEIEFAEYQLTDILDSVIAMRVDQAWLEIGKLKDHYGQLKFKFLPKCMLIILTISHSNAEDERIFSIVRKNSTEFRANLSTKVISDTLTTKMYWQAAGIPCYKRDLNNELLDKCKKATMEYNQKRTL